MKPAISILGTGRMGSALARALLRAGYRTTVWNRTFQKAEPLAAIGATIAASVVEAIHRSQIIIVNVSDYAVTADLLRATAVAGALGGKLVIELTSGTPHGARVASLWFAERQVGYLDGAILASPDFIGTDGGAILVAGPSSAFSSTEDVFRSLCGKVQHLGEAPGLANALDSAVLSLMWGALFGALHAIAVCRAEAIDLDELARQWSSTASVVEGLVADLIKRTRDGRFASDHETLSTISPHYGAFRHLLDLMDAHRIDRTVVDGYHTMFQRAIAAGHLHDDFAAMSQFTAQPA